MFFGAFPGTAVKQLFNTIVKKYGQVVIETRKMSIAWRILVGD